MLATPHMLAGAAIGVTGARFIVSRPAGWRWLGWLFLPLALLSHFALDTVPHLDSHGLFGAPVGGITRAEMTAGVVDLLVGSILVILLSMKAMGRGKASGWMLLAGGILGILPDTDILPGLGPWLRATSLAPVLEWHHAIQWNVPRSQWPLGFTTQAVVGLLGFWVCLRSGARRTAAGTTTRVRDTVTR